MGPLFLILSILIKVDSPGPVFYQAKRTGKNGRVFGMYKFRTMRSDADKISSSPSCADDDPRVTRLGRILRDYKLNELPQFINVLLGDMSFVGPRPEVPSEVATYSVEEKRILTVRPGITDYASLAFHNEGALLNGYADPHEAYRKIIKPGKLRLALKYVDTHSMWEDVKIIWATALMLVGSRAFAAALVGNETNGDAVAYVPSRQEELVGPPVWTERPPAPGKVPVSKVPVRR